jgi:hypothetical protein
MVQAIGKDEIPLEKAWLLDIHESFRSFNTFLVYVKALQKQIDRILSLLQKLLILYRGDTPVIDQLPDRKSFSSKTVIMFSLIEELKDSMHRKGIYGHVLNSENAYFLNHLLFSEAGLIFLKNTS